MGPEQRRLMAAIAKAPDQKEPREEYAKWLDAAAESADRDADEMEALGYARDWIAMARDQAKQHREFAAQVRASAKEPDSALRAGAADGKLAVGDRVRVRRQKPTSNWAHRMTGRIIEITEFIAHYYPHAPGVCYEVQLDDPDFPPGPKNPGLFKTVMNVAGQERQAVRTYPFSAEALEPE